MSTCIVFKRRNTQKSPLWRPEMFYFLRNKGKEEEVKEITNIPDCLQCEQSSDLKLLESYHLSQIVSVCNTESLPGKNSYCLRQTDPLTETESLSKTQSLSEANRVIV